MSDSDVADGGAAAATNTEPNLGESVAPQSGEALAPQSGPVSESFAEAQRRRSSIRPVSPDWQPPSRSDQAPRPMVVVYSGDSQAPVDWEALESEGPATERETPAELFMMPRDLPLPSIPDFEALAPPIQAPALELSPVGAMVFDGRPVSAIPPEEIDALVAYELARAEFRAELETPSVRRPARLTPPDPVPAEPAPAVVAPEEEVAPPRRARPAWPLIGGGLLSGVALAVGLGFRTAPSASEREGARVVPEAHAVSPQTTAGLLLASAAAAPPVSNEAVSVPALASPTPSPSASEAEPELDPNRKSTHVVMDVFPLDAKVMMRGMKRRGPPYEFDVPRGRRVTVEVSRKGFVPRKVVLDGKVTSITIGLNADKRMMPAEATIGVRSGL